MRLYLVQHGEAKSEDEDPDRPLTERGAADVRRVVGAATATGVVVVDRLVNSGKTRARQTAAVWSEALGVATEEADALAPMDDPAVWARRLADQETDLMLVGHMPHLARLTALLATGDAGRPVVAFRNAGLVGLERAEDRWSVWLVLPPTAV